MSARVLHLITESNLGGAQLNTLATVRRLPRGRFEPILACGLGGPGDTGALLREAQNAGIETHEIGPLIRPVRPLADLAAYRSTRRLIRRLRPSIVHTHSTKAGFLGRLAARAEKVPVIVHTLHGVPFRLEGGGAAARVYLWLERRCARFTDALISVSQELALRYELAGICPAGEAEVIYSGISFSRLDVPVERESVRAEFGFEPDMSLAGFVGRFSEQKAPEVVVRAAAEVLARRPRVGFLLVGEGRLRASVEQQIADLGLTGKVVVAGERADVPRLLRAFDIFVAASRWEGVGRALTEAMFVGLPVVAAPVNGVGELLEDGVTGLAAGPDDPAALAAAVERLLDDRQLAGRLGQAAHERVRRMMSAETMVERIAALYDRQLAGAGDR